MRLTIALPRTALAAAVALLLFPLAPALLPRAAAHAQPAQLTQSSTITGVVVSDEGVPVAAALVRLLWRDARNVLRDRTTRSDDGGAFRIDALPTGAYALTVRRIGFEPYDAPLTLARGESWQLLVELTGVAQELDEELVNARGRTGKMIDFERRRNGGTGTFITRADIELKSPRAMSDLLRILPGIAVSRDELGERDLRFRGMGSVTKACPPDFYVDGAFVPNFNVDVIPPRDVEGVEVYRGPAATPAAFRAANTSCGVIAIWTRDPGRR